MNFIYWLWISSVFFCIQVHLVDSQALCSELANTGLKDGEVYENAATGKLATTLGLHGEIGTEINLTLSGNLDKFFLLVGKDIIVKDSTTLDRTSSELQNNNLKQSIDITGSVQCKPLGSTQVNKAASVNMKYINKYPPTITSDDFTVQSEYIGVGVAIPFEVTSEPGVDDPLDEEIIALISSQDPPGFFSISNDGVLTVEKDLDYTKYPQHILNLLKIADELFQNP